MNTTAVIEREPLLPFQTPAPSTDPRPATGSPQRRHLRPVRTAVSRRRGLSPLLAALTCVGILLAIFAAQLGLSIAVSEGAYEARALELEQRDLMRVERVLAQNVDKLSSPQNLAENAVNLGMVQNSTPATLRLSDHKILGSVNGQKSAVQDNLVPNATLKNLPVVDADGLLVSRNEGQAERDAAVAASTPVPWQGELPAPDTH